MCAVTDEVLGVNFWSFWSGMIDQLGALTKSGLGATWGPEKKIVKRHMPNVILLGASQIVPLAHEATLP